ncbi:hypothetical protein [Cryobacterium gelidum]|uniref:hypothetical protein n=1 Tax=Cryobacterium gelidum TaxID=1259164 RepID=UPI00141A8EF9|nr:hypothetical protein [Cryobacterium gelidum]
MCSRARGIQQIELANAASIAISTQVRASCSILRIDVTERPLEFASSPVYVAS